MGIEIVIRRKNTHAHRTFRYPTNFFGIEVAEGRTDLANDRPRQTSLYRQPEGRRIATVLVITCMNIGMQRNLHPGRNGVR